MTRQLIYRFNNWTGKSFWRNLFGEKTQARWVAKWMLRDNWKGADPDTTPFIIQMPGYTYRIIDRRGHVEVTDGDPSIRMLQ